MTVGDKIRKYRLEQGYTQKELAIKAGLSESAIRNYELKHKHFQCACRGKKFIV